MDKRSIGAQKVDWHGDRLIDELVDHGWSIYRIAQHLDKKWDTIKAWRIREPKYSDAQALIRLHAKVVIVEATTSGICVPRETYR